MTEWLSNLSIGDDVLRLRADGKGQMRGTVRRITKTLIVVSGPREEYEAYYRSDGSRWPKSCWMYKGHRMTKP